jgi:hypothetical protein
VIAVRSVALYHVPSVSLYMSAINAVDKSVSGLPLRPPLSTACLSDRLGIRSVVVLEITRPSTQHCRQELALVTTVLLKFWSTQPAKYL